MGHAHSAPELPEVTDEAADTPKWVPLLGVALFVLAVAGIVMGHCSNPNAEGEGDVAADAQN
jgi:hypothetical protein